MVTIFTPTYNRKNLLLNLKVSLDNQIDRDFEWIIVDDGSTDDTERAVSSWLHNVDYFIRYYKQQNSGKHCAFNKAVKMAQGDIFVCVDSDDVLTPEAVGLIKSSFLDLDSQDVGVVSPRVNRKGEQEPEWQHIDSKKVDIIDLKEVYGIVESAIAIRTNILQKEEPFIEFENEKFLPEGWLYLDLSRKGKFIAKSKAYYISEYQETGLTKNIWNHWENNYQGVLATLKKKYEVSKKYDFVNCQKVQIKTILNINSLCLATHQNVFKITPSKMKSIIFFVPSWCVYRIRYRKN
jgi:glycosyltransferase involved in cell wall biosynthesis